MRDARGLVDRARHCQRDVASALGSARHALHGLLANHVDSVGAGQPSADARK